MPLYKTVIGIGGTTGGFNSLKKFFNAAKKTFNPAIVILQNLDTLQTEELLNIIKTKTSLASIEVSEPVELESSTVYLSKSGCRLIVKDSKIYPEKWNNDSERYHSLDSFFSSLADHCEENAVGILLSGIGIAGIMGLQKIKKKGGLIIVQDPETAECSEMPSNAIKNAVYDTISAPEDMPAYLTGYAGYAKKTSLSPGRRTIDEILNILYERTGHDFSNYKITTIKRRIKRQMSINRSETPEDYTLLIKNNENALNALFRDFMIGVTGFFRDMEAFSSLEQTLIPELISKAEKQGSPVRIWIPGCSTGEETYSIAIAFKEYMRINRKDTPLQIFASDIDQAAIAQARRALYSYASIENIPCHLLDEYFEIVNEKYRPVKSIRDSIVYSVHSIIKDPPFSRVDLISCRNVMIYLNSDVQKNLISLFHYALNPEGFLFIGSSETIGTSSHLFSEVDSKNRIYRRLNTLPSARATRTFATQKDPRKKEPAVSRQNRGFKKKAPAAEQLDKTLLKIFTPTAVMTDLKGEILHIHKATEHFFYKHPLNETTNILSIAREGITDSISRALRESSVRAERMVFDRIEYSAPEGMAALRMTVIPGNDERSHLIFIFEDQPYPFKESNNKKKNTNLSYVESLEMELRETREYLETVIRKLDAANEELKSTNEEHLASNEELHSANEELQTSQEELQSMNEELLSLNNELGIKNHELIKASSDIENLLLSIKIAIIFLDKNLKIMRFTPESEKLFNLIPGDIGRPLSHIVHNFCPEIDIFEKINYVTENGSSFESEMLTKDGSCFSMRILPYISIYNEYEGVVITFNDITEQKQREARIAESEEKFRTLTESTSLAILIYQNDKFVYVNPKAEEISGYTADELYTMNFWEFTSPEYKDIVKQNGRKRQLGEGAPSNYEFQIISKDGKAKWVLLTGDTVTYQGQYAGMISVIDISEKKIIENSLKESEERLRSFIENAVDGIVIFNKTENLTAVNNKTCELTGYTSDELYNRKLEDILYLEKKSNLLLNYDLLNSGIDLMLEATLHKKDGTSIPVEMNTRMMPDGTYQAIIRDITDKKKAEEEREKNHRLESLGVLAGGIAHDFNNILTSVLGNVTLAKLKAHDPEIETLLTEAENGGFKARDLTHQLLTFSKGGAPVKKNARIEELIKDSAEFILHGSKTSISYSFDENLFSVNIDSAQISQVIQNLIINAEHSMPKGGNIKVRASNYVIYDNDSLSLQPGNYVKIDVIDEGIGIHEDVIYNIFDPYFTTKEKGSGLGLSICHSIIKKHEGIIEVESNPEKGSVFRFYLPASESEPVKTPEIKNGFKKTAPLKILFMDDDKSLQRVAVKMLKTFGHSVDTASDGIEAMKLYYASMKSGHTYDVVVTDLTIPGGMGGIDLITELLIIDPDVTAIVSSGYSNDPVMSEYREYGFKGVIEKPFEINRFMERIYAALEQ